MYSWCQFTGKSFWVKSSESVIHSLSIRNSSSPLLILLILGELQENPLIRISADFSTSKLCPHENISTEAYEYSGHVCTQRCDSAIDTTPVTPCGLNLKNVSPTTVAPQSRAAFINSSLTWEMSSSISGSQCSRSSSRCVPSDFNIKTFLI